MKLLSCTQTHVGRRRKTNQDQVFAADGLFVVCDGMGGHKAGEVASAMAVETVVDFIQRTRENTNPTWLYGFDARLSWNGNLLRTAIKLANESVSRAARSTVNYAGMGTTLVAAFLPPNARTVTYASVGDSRLYLIRGRTIRQLTHDDSWLNLISRGNASNKRERAPSGMKNVLTKALGAHKDIEFEVADFEVFEGDVIILCSDGLTNMVSDRHLLEIVGLHGLDLAAAARAMINAANAAGGRDNASVVLLACAG